MFPVLLPIEYIEACTIPGQIVYEPFSGSGTTIIAGEMTGRHIYAIELSPAYTDVACMRWANFTGKTPILDADGRTFVEVMAERQPNAKLKASVTVGSSTSGTKTTRKPKAKAGTSPPT